MQQLWLNHKRIDSIDQLRTLLSEARAAEDSSDALCLRLLEYAHNGVLSGWLGRQSEAFGGGLDPEVAKLATSIQTLRNGSWDSEALHQALSDLTGVPVACFATEHVRRLHIDAQLEKEKKLAQLRQQKWWPQYKSVFEQVKEHDWPLVVLDSSQLQMALEYMRKDSAVHQTLYICNTEQMHKKWFVLNLKDIENATIVGIENPRVQYDRFHEDVRISVKSKRIFLQDLEIIFHKEACLDGFETNSSNFRVSMR